MYTIYYFQSVAQQQLPLYNKYVVVQIPFFTYICVDVRLAFTPNLFLPPFYYLASMGVSLVGIWTRIGFDRYTHTYGWPMLYAVHRHSSDEGEKVESLADYSAVLPWICPSIFWPVPPPYMLSYVLHM